MIDDRPGLNPRRLSTLMQAAVERLELNLRNRVVLTEAATGVYVITPVLAAMAGARQVFAIARTSRYGTIDEVKEQTQRLAQYAGLHHRIEIVSDKSKDIVTQADIVTNSGHVRPIDAEMIGWMKPMAVIPLMYEAWEFRSSDVDLEACRGRGIPVAGTNERHKAVDVFPFLGVMAVKLLLDSGVSVYTSNIMLLCDNPLARYIRGGISNAGASVETFEKLSKANCDRSYDAVLVALKPRSGPVLSAEDAAVIAASWSGAVVTQFWGDVDRPALLSRGVPVWPARAPPPGHMGILLSDVGPEPVIRLQAAGLKVGEILYRQSGSEDERYRDLVQPL